ncbi:hypothetical protein AB7C87_08215 [Natrarchaeobius sp. A-rgal3]|uniref:DUF7260 family protein n=1 Tax=Natrarchaeobius versutus TaxID=1679078 RepID=UPI00351037A9
MTTIADRARERVSSEAEAVERRLEAIETFERRVRDIPVDQPNVSASRATNGMVPTLVRETTPAGRAGDTTDRCAVVRREFARTIEPHSTADIGHEETLVETIAAEFTDDVALALTTGGEWTQSVKTAVLERTAERRSEADGMRTALEAERQSVRNAIDVVDDVTEILLSVTEGSLLDWGFDRLRKKHERLETAHERLESLLETRQRTLSETANRYRKGGHRHRSIVEYLYAEFRVTYPIVSIATRLCRLCRQCQRTLRDQLTRRV